MKKHLVYHLICFVVFLIASSTIIAQQPAWIDYAKRTSQYPESDYLTGFVSAENVNDEDPGKLMDQYEELAKNKVIQSIEVSIETNNSLTLSNVNGKSEEVFQSNSISFSSAKITGLKVERYYDKKKKNVYAFAYVDKKRLAYYNRKLISANLEKTKQKLSEGQEYLALNDKQNALKSFYEGMPLLAEAEEAQWLMMAINRDQFVENDLKEIRKYKVEINKGISRLQHSKELNIGEAAYFVAYGLFIQLNTCSDAIYAETITFENTSLDSEFSEKWNTEVINALVKTGNYNVKANESPNIDVKVLKGNYWEEGNQLRVHTQLIQNGNILAAAEGIISLSWLNKEGLAYLPEQLVKIDQLQSISLTLVSAPEQIKIGKQAEVPMVVLVEMKSKDGKTGLENITLIFSDKNGKTITRGSSDADGLVSVYFPEIIISEGKNEIFAQVDLATYANIDTSTAFFSRVKYNNPVLPATFVIEFVPQVYYVFTDETISRRPVEIKIIEPDLKNELNRKGFQFVENQKDADYMIVVKAATTAGNTYQGIYFSFVDATMSIVDVKSGNEKFKTSVEQVKGGGANSKKAGIKALNLASEELKEKLIEYLSAH